MSEPQVDVLDILEKRVEEIENKLFGYKKLNDDENLPLPENTLIDSIGHANTLISSALSGRENINALINRLPELEKFIDSDFNAVDTLPQTQAEYIALNENEIKENVQLLNKLNELMPLLDSDKFRNVLEKSNKLNELVVKYIEFYKKTDIIKKETHDMLDRYNETITNFSKALIAADAKITTYEQSKEKKKVLD